MQTNELDTLELPPLRDDLLALLKRYEEALDFLDSAPDTARDLEQECNEVVYDLYDLDKETKSLIRERVVRPENPLEPREVD